MKKILSKDYILFGILFLITVGIGENISIAVSDELWNFQNIYKIYNGYGIYEGANIIITPLFFYIGNLIFKIFGANFFVFRLYNCVLVSILFFMIYKILKELIKSKKISIILTIIAILYSNFFIIAIGANYNIMALDLVLVGIYLLIKNKIKNTQLIQGIITGLIFFTKQNIGVYYGIAYFIYMIFDFKNNKYNIKDILKNISKYLLGGIGISLIFILELIINDKISGFIDYAILGMKEFSLKNIIIELNNFIFFISIILINILLTIYLLKKAKLENTEIRNLKIMLPFSIALAMWTFPIFNKAHILLGILVTIINLIYCIFIMFKDIIKENKVINIIMYILIIYLLLISGIKLFNWCSMIFNENYYFKYDEPYFGGVINEEQYRNIKDITSYIEKSDKDIIILSEKAGLYMIPLKECNGKFDLPLLGNLGKAGEEGLVEEIKHLENTQILLYRGKGEISDQEAERAIDYVRKNWIKIDSIYEFDIYEKNLHKICKKLTNMLK